MLLASVTDIIRVITGSAVTTDALATWADTTASAFTPGNLPRAITTAATTTLVESPAASTFRQVKFLVIRNKHASSSNEITLQHFDGATAFELWKGVLAAGESLAYTPESGFVPMSALGIPKSVQSGSAPASNTINIVVLAGNVVNANAIANTIADVTALSFPVTADETYWYEFVIPYTSAATGTGSRWAINGPAAPTMLSHRSEYVLTATTMTNNNATAYDIPAASNATSRTTGNVATMWGVIRPSASGTVIARFASEVSSSAITALAGATLRWVRVL